MSRELLNFFFELGQLRRIKHEGWRTIGIENPESVADHSLRAAQIGYFLAKLEKYKNPEEIVTMLVFHDMGECRIGDIHKIATRYVKADEKQAVKDQLAKLEKFRAEIYKLWESVEYHKNIPGKIAKDADLLEQAITAKEYIEKGYKYAQNWIDNISKNLETASSKKLIKELRKSNSNDWWQGIKKIF
ncbi:MAG: HD family hydrolase [Candidatus Gracilibacteria bacterium]|jgi:putative hydrolase of HD superfamily